jgi:outer membrane murein-binding lipoprotein Lpp
MKSLWKYITGLFTFVIGLLVLSGKKNKKVKEIKGKIKDVKSKVKKVDSKITSVKEESDAIKKSLKSKKKALKEIKNQKFKKKDISAKDAANFLKKYKGKK